MQDLSIDDILAIFKRRRVAFIATFAILFAIAFLYTITYSRYRASVTVQIEQPYVASAVTNVSKDSAEVALGLADRRISQIQQRVTSVESLNKIIQSLNLYPGINKKLPESKLAAIMRSKIKLAFISSEIANPAAVQKESVEQLSAIAFTLTYDYNDPEVAKKALDAIVKAFIDEEANQRRAQAKETASFLAGEIKTLEATIDDSEAKIAKFRAQYGESGPAATLFNQQASLNNTMTLQTVESQIAANESTIANLRSQLGGMSPYMDSDNKKQIRSGPGQLSALNAEYAALKTKYGPEHPDLKRVSAEIAAIKATGTTTSVYSTIGADNPMYVQLSAQLASAEGTQRGLINQRAVLQNQQAKYSEIIAKNPGIEQQMNQLSLDLENAKERYRSLKDKKIAAEMQEKLESGNNRNLLKVINPSTVPEGTTPGRKLLLIAGFILALMAATGMVIVRELFSQSIRGVNHLAAIVGVSPLVAVPHIEVTRG